ncbi:uncharacterized protein LOC143372940 isoform X1 [Andrena cerasifolii]|uniref:uncharacterized protein LOC143372940 isoform X1 n=1 Tax=Andrena cerasifolii TaxID=2819439 RepID=UPI004037DBB8
MNTQEATKVPPDGKWGWMIVLAYGLNGMATVSLLQGFGLIFKDTFPLYGFNATEGTIIINTNIAFGMILGLINGPLLRIFGYRKMAIVGSLLYTIGVTMTAFARTFPLMMLSYGICASLGISITTAAFSYALNSYFTTKRGRALSVALTIIGLGPILVPQITTFLISFYGFQGTILLYGAFSLHSLVGSMLLHPLKWHTMSVQNQSKIAIEETEKNGKEKTLDEKNISIQDDERSTNSVLDLNNITRRRKITISSIEHDSEIGSIYGFDIPFARQFSETLNVKCVDTVNLGSSMKIFEENRDSLVKYSSLGISQENNREWRNTMENEPMLQQNGAKTTANVKMDSDKKSKKKFATSQIFMKISQTFDLDLLRDPVYVNIMLGMSIAIFSEINFSQLTPFILTDMNLSTKEIATVMSLIASVDLVFRSLAPFLGEWLDQPPRIMYLLGLVLLIISRSTLLFANGFTSVLIVAVGLGAAKGIRSVYMSLVIPHYVPIEKLPNASGIQMIVNGVMLLTAGPMLGVMRDSIGNYTPAIIMINCVTALTVIMWLVELVIVRRRKAQMENQQQGNS